MNVPIDVSEPSNPLFYKALSSLKRVLLLPRSFHPTHILLKGRPRDGNQNFILNYIGEGESIDYLKGLIFSRILEQEAHPCRLWNLSHVIAKTLYGDILFVELNGLLKRFVSPGGYDTLPWIRQKVYLKDVLSGRRKAKIKGKYGRMARKYRYRCRMVGDVSATKEFYEELYRPYIHFRFGTAAHLRGTREIQRAVKKGFLLQVFDDDGWIAGAACRRRRGEVTLLALGLRSDFIHHLRHGALSSVYYFLFQWAEKNHMQTIDFLRSRPNLADGVYEHKRFWGAKVEKDIWPHTFLRIFIPPHGSIPPALRGFLIWRDDGFVALGKAVKQ